MAGDSVEGWHDSRSATAVRTVVEGGMPEAAVAGYVRWWQLETWVRDLIYVELRAKYGLEWASNAAAAVGRQAKDGAFTHMAGADSQNPLAYLDYSQLLQIVEAHWELFHPSLIEQRSWNGRQHELKQIRHRIGHLRSPHRDDLTRLEQTLRDLERGAHVAYSSYSWRWQPSKWSDAVTDGWIRGRHPDARRLIAHAYRQYDTRLNVGVSARPWAKSKHLRPPETSGPGFLWHADFWMQGRSVDLARLWRDSDVQRVKELIVHVVALDPHAVGFTFAAVDSPADVADAIGAVFDAVLMSSSHVPADINERVWRRQVAETDFRVVGPYGWGFLEESMVPVSIFGAGSQVESSPTW